MRENVTWFHFKPTGVQFFHIILHGYFCGLEIVQLPPILSLCTSCGLALNQHQHSTKLHQKWCFCWFTCGFIREKLKPSCFTWSWKDRYLGYLATVFSWLVDWKLKNKHFVKHRFKWLILVHFFDICCICELWYLLYQMFTSKLGLRSDVRDANQFDIRGQLQTCSWQISWEFQGAF